ncbi:MAG: VanW family protein [Clostridia bacterium]|nr:VanW family protein [Clostridia bacterium]
MNSKEKNKLIFAVMLLVGVLSFSMFSENISNFLFNNTSFNNQTQMLENKKDFDDDNILQTSQTLDKTKKDCLNLEINLEGNTLCLNQDNLVNSDLLEVSTVGGQSIKSTVDFLLNKGYSLETCFPMLFKNWDDLLNSFLKNYEIEPCDSIVTFTPNDTQLFSYSKELSGKKINKQNFYQELYNNLGSGKIEIDLSLENAEPKFTTQKNKEITKEVSHFITDLSNSKKNRHHNVTKALSKINGLVINPNEVISFNTITAPHNVDGGYTNATIISNGEYVNGMGGGICQASSTLYNAVLLAGLKVNQVYKHSIPVSYVKMGLDSMVSNFSDLVFQNTSEYPIYVKAYTDKESAYVYLYGKTMENDECIKRRNEIVRTIPAPETITIVDDEKKYFPKIEYQDDVLELRTARNGYEVNAYLDYYKNNKLIKSEKIRHEIYQPQAKILVIGSKVRPLKVEENVDITLNTDSTLTENIGTNQNQTESNALNENINQTSVNQNDNSTIQNN